VGEGESREGLCPFISERGVGYDGKVGLGHVGYMQGLWLGRCSALPFEKSRTPMLSATPWITDSTIVQNMVIIAIE
jgi:hypothetical protein